MSSVERNLLQALGAQATTHVLIKTYKAGNVKVAEQQTMSAEII